MITLSRLLAAGLVLAAAAPASGREIGTAGAVNPAASGTPPGGATRTMQLGGTVIHRERIRTTAGGSLQVIFVDKTTLNVGPNSDIVIDEFVYDPNSGTGRMAASMAKGVMRFVGGNTSHTGGATIKTPAATLGIRGGVATITHDAQGGTRAVSHYGTLTATTSAATEVIRRPGFAISIPSNLVPPLPPQRATLAEVAATNSQLTSKPGQSGGARQKPTNQQAASSGVARANERVTTAQDEGQRQTVAAAATTRAVTVSNSDLRQLQQEAVVSADPPTTAVAPAPNPPPVVDPVPDPAPPPTQPPPSSFAVRQGWAGGHVTTTNNRSGAVTSPQSLFGSNALIVDQGTGQLQQGIFVSSDGTATGEAFSDGTFQFGSVFTTDTSSSAYSSDTVFTARQAEGGPYSDVNGVKVTREVLSTRSAAAANAQSLFPNVAFCQCEYTRWGLWSAEVDRPGSDGVSYTDRIPQGVWVAGVIPDATQVPTTGTATYTGHAAASISNNGRTYLAGGTMSNVVDFGQRTGAMTVSSLDSRNYAGQVTLLPDTAFFSGTLATTAGPSGVATIFGNFYAGPGGPVQEMGGQIQMSGPAGYTGSGVFLGRAN